MALSTLPDSDEEKKLNPNESDQTFRETFGVDKGLSDIENYANSDGDTSDLKDAENKAANGGTDTKKEIDDLESNWNTPFTGKNTQPGGGKTKGKFSFSWKKQGPIGLIIAAFLGVGGLGVGLNGLLPVHVLENLVGKYNSQETSMTIRTAKIIQSILSGGTANDACDTSTSYICKLQRPSSSFLKSLEENGVTPEDSSGNSIDLGDSEFPDESPTQYAYSEDGQTKTVRADNFASTMESDPNLAADVHEAYNPEFAGFGDKTFQTVENEDGINKRNSTLEDADSEGDETKDKAALNTAGEPEANSPEGQTAATAAGLSSTEGENAGAASTLIEGELEEAADNAIQESAEDGKSGVTGLIASSVCSVANIPGIISTTVRAFQLTQVVRYAMVFLSTASALKAGDATQTQIDTIATALTTVVAGHSAMDSFGMKYTLDGDTSSSVDKGWKKLVPGGSIPASVKTFSYANTSIVQPICSKAVPAATAGFDLVTSESVIGPLVNTALGLAGAFALEKIGPIVVGWIMDTPGVQDLMQSLLSSFLGDMTENLSGMSVGDALVSGSSNMMAQAANAGGNMPLTPTQAVAYDQETEQVQLAYAKEAQATLSPFDASSNYTFLGSIVNSLLPYVSDATSASGFLSTLTSAPLTLLGSIFQPAANAADPTAQYTNLCDDPNITSAQVAAGPFCNVQYGVPVNDLGMDPVQVATSLQESGNIDASGNPTGEYKTWLAKCTSGDTLQIGACKINDDDANDPSAQYAVYTIDHRVITAMDGEDTVYNQTMTASSASSNTTTSYAPMSILGMAL